MELTKRLLFLDDIRDPKDAYTYTKKEVFQREDWHIVRNYQAFADRILEKGLPEMISFDHDLADQHYLNPDSRDFIGKNRLRLCQMADRILHGSRSGAAGLLLSFHESGGKRKY